LASFFATGSGLGSGLGAGSGAGTGFAAGSTAAAFRASAALIALSFRILLVLGDAIFILLF
jgi:hypothetical protein